MDTITVTNAQGRSVSVEYDWEQGRFAGCSVFDSSDAPIFARTVTRAPRRPALVTAVTNAGVQPLTSNLSPLTFAYAYDAVGRPVERNADAFAYNARGEVTNATIDSAAWSYAYDHIGNRTTASDSAGATAYAANAVNQYTAVGAWTPSYDLDGNLQGDGSLGYAWDAAGRLASARDPNAGRGDPWWSFEYDHRGRRVMKRNWTVLGNWSPPDGHSVYFYDGWNLVHEIRVSGSYQTSHVDYFWGPDLSGSLQGAGGVGGLVAVSIDGDYYFPGYDNNGNVVGYWDESGSLVAEYVYDAFGNTVSSSGSMASVFPHRFSTKYYNTETDLYYYGYRYYAPSLGRWISRDPIEEDGGFNLFTIVQNNPLDDYDILGAKKGHWPTNNEEDGWAFLGNMNFPGPGWSGTFKTRPTTLFDLAAKIHDLHYTLNGSEFGLIFRNGLGHILPQWSRLHFRTKSPSLSRQAKADYIFRKMNEAKWDAGRWSGTLNYLSRRVFFDDPKYFCKGDGFINFLEAEKASELNDPSEFLMIPYSQLSTQPVIEETYIYRRHHGPVFSKGAVGGGSQTKEIRTRTIPDYSSIVPEDYTPGFFAWAEKTYGNTWSRIRSITQDTDSSFKWE